MKVLLTGGTGYIGSHTAVELIQAGHEVVIADNLSNSESVVAERIGRITGVIPSFAEMDIRNEDELVGLFEKHQPDAVMHFAGYKAVGESVANPLMYYENNLDSTLTLIRVMKRQGCRILVFSSSATVYGMENPVPFTEDMPAGGCTNPYGWTKFMIEQILKDEAAADPEFTPMLLRYFNPIGAHPSGLIGENPNGIPNNLMPYIQQVASGIREKLYVYGNDYDTPDGTGVRDYIHVKDLARGHVKALEYASKNAGCEVINLGTGKGYSVLEVIEGFKKANGIDIPYEITERREGDIASCYADCSRAEKLLGWKAEKNMEDMCRDAWNWEKNRLK